jgi:DNA modification methylase
MGSGTTGLAAKILGRKYFGCDISQEYVEEAIARINSYPNKVPTSPEKNGSIEQLILLKDSEIEYTQD